MGGGDRITLVAMFFWASITFNLTLVLGFSLMFTLDVPHWALTLSTIELSAALSRLLNYILHWLPPLHDIYFSRFLYSGQSHSSQSFQA